MRLGRVVSMTSVAALFVATGAFGDSGADTSEGSAARQSAAAAKPTLAVVVVGSGRVTSSPAGISCPGKCVARFTTGTRVLLTPTAKRSRFLRWGGNCAGTRACSVRVSALSAVAAEFVGGSSTQPPPSTTGSVDPGAYQGGGSLSLYVPAGARSVQTFTNYLRVDCAGGGAYSLTPKILTTPIKQDRSFTAKTSQSAVVGGASATITYSVTGRFQGRDSSGRATASGIYRTNVVFTDTPDRKCTSNDQPWTATRTLPPATTSVEPGTYKGGGSLSLDVPAGARSVQNFTNYLRVDCAGGGAYSLTPKILTTPIKQDRSFTARTSQSAVVGGASATITYSVTGYFQGRDSSGRATASGIYRADVVFTGTPDRKCTSNNQPWTAARTG